MRSLPIVSFFTDIYGLKFCVQFLGEIFCNVWQCVLLVSYRPFGTAYLPCLQRSSRTVVV